MERAKWAIAMDVGSEFVPFTDIISDIVLLIAVWPDTEVLAPDKVQGCGERVLWWEGIAKESKIAKRTLLESSTGDTKIC